MATAGPAPSPTESDMHDPESSLQLPAPLGDALRACGEVLRGSYDRHNQVAIASKARHRRGAFVAALGGTLAVLFAILQLSGLSPAPWPMWSEVVAALVALASVVLGLRLAHQKQWLLQRHQAERLRLLKFRSLTEPSLWCGRLAEWRAGLLQAADAIRDLTHRSLHAWAETDEVAHVPAAVQLCSGSDEVLVELVQYYRSRRLRRQMAHFGDRADSNERLNRGTHLLPHVLFFLSIVAVLAHFVLDLLPMHFTWTHHASVLCIVLAASLPVVGAGLRTFRSTHQFARNACLFRAKQQALAHLDERLQAAMAHPQRTLGAILQIIAECEQFLEAEHREWLRLMTEAEWFA